LYENVQYLFRIWQRIWQIFCAVHELAERADAQVLVVAPPERHCCHRAVVGGAFAIRSAPGKVGVIKK